MKNYKHISLLLLSFSSVIGLAQGTTELLGPGSVVTGQCSNSGSAPGCVLPSLFGNQGLTVVSPLFAHYAHFSSSAQEILGNTLSSSIATQLVSLPLISPASGFTYRYDSATGAFVRTSSSYGPIYTERADTIGRGKVSFGVSYQAFRFSSLDGIKLNKLPIVYGHLPNVVAGSTDIERDVISTTNNISVNLNQTVLYGTVGLTDRLDLSVSIPIAHMSMGATALAQIQRISGQSVTVAGVNGDLPFNPHSFDDAGSLTKTFSNSGSASGVGDITFRVKGSLYQRNSWKVSGAVDIRTPTGNAKNYLGAGGPGIKPFIIVSGTKGRWSPHMNLGYQWNGNSILAGNITGATFAESADGKATITNGPATKKSLPDLFIYSLGADMGLSPRVTLVFDFLGQTIFNAQRVFQQSNIYAPRPGSTAAGQFTATLPTIVGRQETMALNNGSVGTKISLGGRLLLTANMLFRLDNNGLRQNVTPLVGLSYAFGN